MDVLLYEKVKPLFFYVVYIFIKCEKRDQVCYEKSLNQLSQTSIPINAIIVQAILNAVRVVIIHQNMAINIIRKSINQVVFLAPTAVNEKNLFKINRIK
ncbi:hypothetical protein WQ54_29600 [Bacillus sp. SA1-12]|nr:hypothetical protein WQ54_29600 [Bacillus sp. SA1-12]